MKWDYFMNSRLIRRFMIRNLNNIDVNKPIRYERYYVNDNLRIQNKDGTYEKKLNNDNVIIDKIKITKIEFEN